METKFLWFVVLIVLVVAAFVVYINQPRDYPAEIYHNHEDFAVYLNGTMHNFSQEKYMSSENVSLSHDVHMHSMDGGIVHMHAAGTKMKDFFQSIGMNFTSDCFVLDDGQSFCSNAKNKLLFLPNLLVHLLSLSPYIAVMKNDPLYHYSAENAGKYLKKLEWRIKNNIYFTHTTGSAGFLRRERYEGRNTTIQKYLFIPYSLSIVLPFLDALWLCVTRKNLSYLVHVPLSVITAITTFGSSKLHRPEP